LSEIGSRIDHLGVTCERFPEDIIQLLNTKVNELRLRIRDIDNVRLAICEWTLSAERIFDRCSVLRDPWSRVILARYSLMFCFGLHINIIAAFDLPSTNNGFLTRHCIKILLDAIHSSKRRIDI